MPYVTVEDVKAVFDLGQSFTNDDPAIELALAASVEAVAEYTGRTFADVTESVERIYPGGASRIIFWIVFTPVDGFPNPDQAV